MHPGLFANLRNLLPSARCGPVVFGHRPGYRTAARCAVVDPTGKVTSTMTIYPHEPQRRWDEAKKMLPPPLRRRASGDRHRQRQRPAARPKQWRVARRVFPACNTPCQRSWGVSLLALALAARSLPDLDVSMRGAVSIARPLQDPLAESVKIDPQSMGVGLYQHDVDQKKADPDARFCGRIGGQLRPASMSTPPRQRSFAMWRV